MARKDINWTESALDELYEILNFYTIRNKSTTYSESLLYEIDKRISLISIHTKLGHFSDMEGVRILPVRGLGIIYKEASTVIHILSIWDFRQDPNHRIDQLTD